MTFSFLPEQIESWPIERLHPYERNTRTHLNDQIAKLAAAPIEFGWTSSITVSAEGETVAGHGRVTDE